MSTLITSNPRLSRQRRTEPFPEKRSKAFGFDVGLKCSPPPNDEMARTFTIGTLKTSSSEISAPDDEEIDDGDDEPRTSTPKKCTDLRCGVCPPVMCELTGCVSEFVVGVFESTSGSDSKLDKISGLPGNKHFGLLEKSLTLFTVRLENEQAIDEEHSGVQEHGPMALPPAPELVVGQVGVGASEEQDDGAAIEPVFTLPEPMAKDSGFGDWSGKGAKII